MRRSSPLGHFFNLIVVVGVGLASLATIDTAAAADLYPPASVPVLTVQPSIVPPAVVTSTPVAVPAIVVSSSAVPATIAPKVDDPPGPKPTATVLGDVITPAPNVAVQSSTIAAVSPAYTGANSGPFALVGGVLLVAGFALIGLGRRRTSEGGLRRFG